MMRGTAENQGQGTMQSQTSSSRTPGQAATAQSTRGTQTNGQSTATANTNAGNAQGASLSSDQRSRITDVIKKENIRPETNANFSLSVGTAVPRTVHLRRLPREIIQVEPAWRRYEFVLVNGELVIINPRNFEIVAVMPA